MINEANKPEVKQTVVVYAGRFQPFHPGHYAVYKHLVDKFGKNNVYIGSSDDTSGPKSPLHFKEKKLIAVDIFGVPNNRFVKVKNPYRPVEILGKYDGKTTQYVAALGEKDAERLGGKYFRPYKGKAGYGYDEIGYTYEVPMQSGGISATEVRKGISNKDKNKAKEFFKKVYPKYDAEIFQMIRDALVGLKEEGFPGGVFTGLTSPQGYINGAPKPKDVKKMRKKLDTEDLDELFEDWATNYFGEEYVREDGEKEKKPKEDDQTQAQKMGLVHLGRGFYGKKEGQPATHKSEDGKIVTLSPEEAEQQKKIAQGDKGEKPGDKKSKAEEPDDKKEKAGKPKQPEPDSSQKLSGAELKSDAEKHMEKQDHSKDMSPEDKEAHDKIEHEKEGLDHEEKAAYEFLEDVSPEERANKIDEALKNRTLWEKFSQDTMVGQWLNKKAEQMVNTGKGIASLVEHGKLGVTQDCSGAPEGPHAGSRRGEINKVRSAGAAIPMMEDAESRRKYLSGLDKSGKKKEKEEPKDKSKCKDAHYSDYQKRDEKGNPVYRKKTVPDYETGEKPDPQLFSTSGGDKGKYHAGLMQGYVGPKSARGETGMVSAEDAFTADELDTETGFFKRDEKYYDKNGDEVDKKGNKLGDDGNPKQKKTFWRGKPKTKTIEEPVYEDGLTHEQKHTAHESHHASHEQQHALVHTGLEIAAIAGSIAAAPYVTALAGKVGFGASAGGELAGEEAAHHGASTLMKHIMTDMAKHSAFEILGADIGEATIGGTTMVALGLGESVLLENKNDEASNREFFTKLLKKTMEQMKTYQLTPQQKLKSIQDYKKKKKIRLQKEKHKNRLDLIKGMDLKESVSDTKQKSIDDFVEWATKQLKLSEKPQVKLVSKNEMGEMSSLGGYNPDTKKIIVQSENRLSADIIRTIAHEMVHRKQDELGLIKNALTDGATGSSIENQANSVAGILLRQYGKRNKAIYTESKQYTNEAIIDDTMDSTFASMLNNVKSKYQSVQKIQYDTHDKTYTFVFGDKKDADEFRNKFHGTKYQSAQFDKIDYEPKENPTTFFVKFKTQFKEDITIPVNKGDEVLVGKFKNKRITVKDISTDDHGMPTINGRSATTFRTTKKELNEVSVLAGSDAQPDGAYLPKGKTRILGKQDGANKGDKWYHNGGYTQVDFPTADAIYGDDEADMISISYVHQNLPRSKDEFQTDFETYDGPTLNERLLTEGGAAGHMSHPFDDMNLTFGDLKTIITGALTGELGVVKEKLDGQALAISWKKGRLIAARNKTHLKNAGLNAMGIEDVASKFAGRGGLTDAYNFAMKDLNAAISGLSQKQKEKIFNEGKCFMNIEVIWPESVNVIPYGQAMLVFHNTTCYDDDGNATGADASAARTLAGMIKQINANVQSRYTISGPAITEIPKTQKLSSKQSGFLSKLNKLQNEFGAKDDDTMGRYHEMWWENFIEEKAPVTPDKITKSALVRRWAFGDKSFRLNTISNEELRDWAMKTDKVNVEKQQRENMKKFEEIFLGVGSEVLQFVSSAVTVNPDAAVRAMKDDLASTADEISKSSDAKKIEKFKNELKRLKGLGGVEKIVPIEGIVFQYNGKVYKLTGTFAPLNQLLGIFYS